MTDDRDNVEAPAHYVGQVPGVEMTDVAQHFGFCLGNVIKYCWRAGRKDDGLEDLRKARWYLNREIANVEAERARLRDDLERDAAASESLTVKVDGQIGDVPVRVLTVHSQDGSSRRFGVLPPVERWHE